jgi:hypothetical protein
MELFDRYLQGDAKAVYDEIYALRSDALNEQNFPAVDIILQETFRRVAYNLDIIYHELVKENYQFTADIKHDWQRPLMPPDPNVEALLIQLKSKLRGSYLPLSLEYFYRYAGSCNFCWDWETNPVIPWEGADPLDIPPISTMLEMVESEDLENELEFLLISGDDLTKDNISGSTYSLELTPEPAVDSLIHMLDLPFIEYLRKAIHKGGFFHADQCDYDDLDAFVARVRPQLKIF